MRNPGELRLLVMARLAPVLRHDINNLMTVLKLDESTLGDEAFTDRALERG